MTTQAGGHCPRCGTWIVAGDLRCICGFEHKNFRREALTSIASGLIAWVLAFIVGFTAWIHYWATPLCLVVAPLPLVSMTSAIYGISNGWRALEGRRSDKALALLGLLICAALFIAPFPLLIAARRR
jgi:hypothetical protein